MIPYLLGLENLDRQRDDLHEHIALFAKLTGDRAEDTGTLGGSVLVDEDDGIVIEADGGAILSLVALLDADDDTLDDFGLLDLAVGDGVLDGADDDISDRGVATEAAPEHTEDPDGSRTGVIGDHEVSFVLDHALFSLLHDLDKTEALVVAERTAFLEHHDIADLGLVLAIVDLELLANGDSLLVDGMSLLDFGLHDDGLLHVVADDLALELPSVGGLVDLFDFVSHARSPYLAWPSRALAFFLSFSTVRHLAMSLRH